MRTQNRFFRLLPVVLLAVFACAASASAASASRLSKFFLQYNAALASTTTVRTAHISAASSFSGALPARRALGWRPSPLDMQHFAGQDVAAAITGRKAGAPALLTGSVSDPAYDLRTYNKLTPVRDQGYYGTCWSFASYGSLESSLMPGESRSFSENNIAMNAGFDTSDPMNSGGNSQMAAAYLARWNGPVNESCRPYKPPRTLRPVLSPI
jgi:C1A family cysteine protease